MNRLPSLVRQHLAAFRGLLFFTVLTGIIALMAGYALAKVDFTGKRAFFFLMLILLMVPPRDDEPVGAPSPIGQGT